MKKLLFFITAALLLGSCKQQEVDLVFGTTPELRIKDTLAHIKSTLVGAENGWIAYTSTVARGGYGFFMEFYENDRLSMVADLNNTTATEAKESTYRVRQIMAPTLSFDTYNYITIPQDPLGDNNGGANGDGLQSDIEFEYIRTSGDSLIFLGRKYDQDLVLVKATAAQQDQYTSGGYLPAIDKSKQYFVNNAIPYITVDGIRYQIFINSNMKVVEMTGINEEGNVLSGSGKFYFGLDGVMIPAGVELGEVKITKLIWKDEETLAAYNVGGDEYVAANSPDPFLPLHLLMGSKYAGLRSPYMTIFSGTSETGLEILSFFHDGLGNGATGYTFNHGNIYLLWNLANSRIELQGFSSQNGGASGWTTIYAFDYTRTEDGVYSLTRRSGPEGGYVSVILQPLVDFLLGESFALDYELADGEMYGKITGTANPDVVMTFRLE